MDYRQTEQTEKSILTMSARKTASLIDDGQPIYANCSDGTRKAMFPPPQHEREQQDANHKAFLAEVRRRGGLDLHGSTVVFKDTREAAY